MRTTREPRGLTFGEFLTGLFLFIVAGGFLVMIAIQFGYTPPLLFGPGLDAPQPPPTVRAVQQPPAPVQQYQPIAPPAPATPVQVQQYQQYEPLPPAEVPVEEVQPKAEVVQVERQPGSITIIRTVPVNPSGETIIVDKGTKRKGGR